MSRRAGVSDPQPFARSGALGRQTDTSSGEAANLPRDPNPFNPVQ